MANTLTNLIPDVYTALDVVSRELTGFLPSVTRDATADRAAINQTVRSFVTPANSAAGNISPSMTAPSAADQTITNIPITIDNQRFAPFSWTGEEEYAMDQGPGFLNVRQDQIAQAIRTLVNEMESDVYEAAYKAAGSTIAPNGASTLITDLTDAANTKKLLDDNGAPATGRSLIISTAAGVNLRKQTQLTKVNEAGDRATLRDGELLDLFGQSVKESAAVVSVADSGATGVTVNNGSGYAVGATSIAVDGVTGTPIVGDVISDGTYFYTVTSVTAGGAGEFTLTISAPGLKAALADDDSLTVLGDSTRTAAFSQNAIVLASRLPVTPRDGDQALGREVVTDPRTGISFEFVKWPGYDMNTYHVRACWGVHVLKPEHIAIIADA